MIAAVRGGFCFHSANRSKQASARKTREIVAKKKLPRWDEGGNDLERKHNFYYIFTSDSLRIRVYME